MPNPLDKVINLIKKTGDNSIIVDNNGEPQYVVMSFEKYQAMVSTDKNLAGLTENQLLEKINEDVAAWRQSNTENPQVPENVKDIEENAEIEEEIEEEKPSKQINNNTFPQTGKPEVADNSLNEAKKEESSEDKAEKYYFEPID